MTITTSQAFQWLFDNMEQFSFDSAPVVGVTLSRNFIPRSVSRGPAPPRFTVKMPDGMPWSKIRDYIAVLDAADRISTGTVGLTNNKYGTWLGNSPQFTGKTWTVLCINKPKWTIFARDQVSWSGAFEFVEVPA